MNLVIAILQLCLYLGLLLPAEASPAADGDQVATITKFFGKAQILANPSATRQGQGPHVLFEDSYYTVEPAKVGSKLQTGSIIQTAEKTMVRLVYANGDQIMVSAASSYKVTLEKKGGEEKPISELIYGKFRAVISKEGPRNNMEVRTRSMVMGIRGTDFHVVAFDEAGASVVSVLRGAVAVSAKPKVVDASVVMVEVKSGFSAVIPVPVSAPAQAAAPQAAAIQMNATDKVDLQAIRESVSFSKEMANNAPQQPEDPALQKALSSLEQKAVESTKIDIKGSDPDLYRRIEAAEANGKKLDSIEVLQAVTLEKALVRAPEPTLEKIQKLEKLDKSQHHQIPAKKPTSQELDEMEGSIYDKYFRR